MENFSSKRQARLFSYLLLSSVSFSSLVFAQNNNIVIDKAAHAGAGAPNIVQSSNGTDVLNIVKPTAGGVSHNKFLEYNVSDKNLILNNHAYKTGIPQAESTLGGTVAFNPNFGTGDAARVILNEVTSNSTTALEGYTEIFGQKAALVIANPNGITAAGAGFINLSRLTMITGKPNVVDGKIQDFNISPVGILKVEGKGEQAFGLHIPDSPAELVSNTVKIAGNIYVDDDQELKVLSGNDKYDYNTQKVTSKAQNTTPTPGDDSAEPQPQVTVAIDSSALGGMYAGRISVQATQSGMGINLDGNLVADMDNLEITADGDIAFKNVAAKNNIKTASAAGSVEHKSGGTVHAENDLSITAGKNIALNGTSYAQNNISATAENDISSEGTVYAENNISLTAQNDIALSGDFVLSDTLDINAGKDISSGMQVAALSTANLTAGNDINVKSEFVNAADLALNATNNIVNDAQIVADNDLTATAGNNLTNNGTILAQNTGTLEAGNAMEINGESVSAKNLNLKAATLTNNARIATEEVLTVETGGDITNNSKIAAGTDANLSADNIHNLGQIAANGNINISTQNDYINHRDSGLLAGADIVIEAGKDIINYLAEIFAGNDIELKGKDAKIGDVDPEKVYDNPNIENKHTSTSEAQNDQEIKTGEFDEADGGLDITLTELGKTLTIPVDAFAEEPKLGDSYTLDGYTIYIGKRTVTPSEDPDGEPTISFEDIDKLTILDADGNEVAYTVWDEAGSNEDHVEAGGNTEQKTSETINEQVTSTPYTASQDQFNALVNLGGRIESFNDINIKSDKIYNMGYNHNTGEAGYSTYYDKIRDVVPYNAGWLELGRYKISEVFLDAEEASILAGHDLNINSRDILNQSSTLSAKNNATINTEQLKNQTYSELVTLNIQKQMRRKYKKRMRTRHKTYWATETYQERIYSNEASLVTAGNNLAINAAGGNVVNDQVEKATGSFRFGRDEVPDLKSGKVEVDLTVPRGDKGMFAVTEGDPKYMITANVDFMNNTPFIGSDYFFDRITPFSNEYNTRKMLGDPAYETRLIMDAIREATYGHYLGNGEISNDLDQMKALYNNTAKEYERLDLKIGIALTPEQIKQLDSDIIWYVEKEVNGEKVLVPELYLCETTLENIKIGGYGAKMTGNNVSINADNISNSGDLYAKNELLLKAKDLLNESNRGKTARIIGGKTDIDTETLTNRSATIGGEVTTIKAGDVINETKKYTEEVRDGKNYTLIEKTGQEAVISGDKGLQIDASGTYASKGAKLESKEGDVALKADNIVLDTVELHNREERSQTKSGFLSKKTTTTVKDSIKNVGSAIVAGGNAFIESIKDIFSKGSKVEAGADAQIVAGGDITAVAAEDSSYSYSKTKKSSWGGLKKSLDEIEHEEKRLRGSNIKTTEGLTVVSGKDTTIVASDVEAGKDVNILAGYKAGADGKVEKSGEQGSVNILSGEETTKHREVHEKTNMMDGLKEIGLAVATGGQSLWFNDSTGIKDGKLQTSVDLGEKTKDTWDNVQKNTVSSNIKAGGDINMSATEDINIKGSNIKSDNNITMAAGHDVNITSSQSTEDDKKTHSKSKITANAHVGHVAVDAVNNIDDVIKAGEKVKEARDKLSEIKKLHAEGKASSQAVEDAELNLAAAIVNQTTAIEAAATTMKEAANTEETLGFYAGGGITTETTKTETNANSVTNTASTVIADKDIKIDAGHDMNQTGSIVVSEHGNIDYNVANNLNLQSSQDKYKSNSKTTTDSVSATVSSKSGPGFDVATSDSSDRASGTHHNNSATIAEEGKIAINVGNDMNAEGYNALAKDVDINVGGDMKLASQQNTDYSSSKSSSTSIGGTTSGSNASGSVGNSHGSSDRQWVDEVTSIVGTESVDIDVDGKLSMDGSLIANIDKDGKDAGNLDIKAGSIETSDILNYDRDKESGFNIAESYGPDKSGTSTGHPSGTTTVGVTDKGSEKEGITQATIGKGNIEVADGSDISDINRDVDNMEIITKDQITGALDAEVTIDNRLFTESGRKEIVDDILASPENTAKVIKDASIVLKSGTMSAVNTVADLMKNMSPEQQKDMLVGLQGQNLVDMAKNIAKQNTSKNPKEFPEIETIQDAAKELLKFQGRSFSDLSQEEIDKVTYIFKTFPLDEEFANYRDNRLYSILDASLDDKALQLLSKARETNDVEYITEALITLTDNFSKNMELDDDITIKFEDLGENLYGQANTQNRVVIINERYLTSLPNDGNPFREALDTVVHEILGHIDSSNIGDKLNDSKVTNWLRAWAANREGDDNYVSAFVKKTLGKPVPGEMPENVQEFYKYMDSATKGMYVRDGKLYKENPTESNAFDVGSKGADYIMDRVDQYDKNKGQKQ